MKTADELHAFYDSTLKQEMETLEQQRRRSVAGCLIVIGILSAVAFFLILPILAAGQPVFLIFLLVGTVVLSAGAFKIFFYWFGLDFFELVILVIIFFI